MIKADKTLAFSSRFEAHVLRGLVLGFVMFLVVPLRAQFYAPETRFHDSAQRHYVVELARVMAWRENLSGPKVAEITYAVVSEEDGAAKWKVKWLDANGQLVREFNVAYPASLLLEGPGFYREVFKQMNGDAKSTPLLTSNEITNRYWKGADKIGYSRTTGLRASFAMLKTPDAAEVAPELAGLLAHTALSTLSDSVSLDPVLLARSAAWLAISENIAKDRDAKLDALWSPLLFLAGRENAAKETWDKANAPKPNAIASCWNFLLAQPTTKDAFLFVAKPENRRFMLPIMNYHCTREEMAIDFENLLPQVFGLKNLPMLYEHLPRIVRSDQGTVSTGQALSVTAPFALQDWIDCLRDFTPNRLDFDGYKKDLDVQRQAVVVDPSNKPEVLEDDCLLGFASAAPLIEVGHREGAGKLIPVATVTSRDLLNYGWEMTGLQIGSRYEFVATKWGVPERAKAIADHVLAKVSGLDVFLCDASKDHPAILAGSDRLQDVQASISSNRGYVDHAVATFDDYSSRHWLYSYYTRFSCSIFYHAGKMDRIIPYVERVDAEGGPLCDGLIRQWFADDLRERGVSQVPGAAEFKTKLAEIQEKKEMDRSTFALRWNDYEALPPLQRAETYEKAYWQGACDDLFQNIFDAYIEAHAYKSAERFYTQIEPRTEPVDFSGRIGPRRFILAMLEGDQAGMDEALKASATGSYADFRLEIIAAAAKDDFDGMEAEVDECIQRYGESPVMDSLKGFIPLIPALRNPAAPDHDKALDYFKTNSDWLTVQWVLATRAKLNTEESVRFFGGPNTDWARQLIVLIFQKDKATFIKKYNEQKAVVAITHEEWQGHTLIHYLRNTLLEIPVPTDQPDLMPSDALPLSQQVIASLHEK